MKRNFNNLPGLAPGANFTTMTVEEKAIAKYEQGVKAGIYELQDIIAVVEREPQRIGHGERSSTGRVQKPTINAAQRVAIRNKQTWELIARFYI